MFEFQPYESMILSEISDLPNMTHTWLYTKYYESHAKTCIDYMHILVLKICINGVLW